MLFPVKNPLLFCSFVPTTQDFFPAQRVKILSKVFSGASPAPQRCATSKGPSFTVSKGVDAIGDGNFRFTCWEEPLAGLTSQNIQERLNTQRMSLDDFSQRFYFRVDSTAEPKADGEYGPALALFQHVPLENPPAPSKPKVPYQHPTLQGANLLL